MSMCSCALKELDESMIEIGKYFAIANENVQLFVNSQLSVKLAIFFFLPRQKRACQFTKCYEKQQDIFGIDENTEEKLYRLKRLQTKKTVNNNKKSKNVMNSEQDTKGGIEECIAPVEIVPRVTKPATTKVAALYLGIMCFVANCLSSMILEVGTRFPLGSSSSGKSGTFNSLFHRNYSLKIKILATNIVAGFTATVMMCFADKYRIPYLYIPWLVNTLQGMAMCEAPALLKSAYVLLPEAGLSAAIFFFITLLLYVEELCLWNDVFANFYRCWIEYSAKRQRAANEIMNESRLDRRHQMLEQNIEFVLDNEKLLQERTDSGDGIGKLPAVGPISSARFENNFDFKGHLGRSRFTKVTG